MAPAELEAAAEGVPEITTAVLETGLLTPAEAAAAAALGVVGGLAADQVSLSCGTELRSKLWLTLHR